MQTSRSPFVYVYIFFYAAEFVLCVLVSDKFLFRLMVDCLETCIHILSSKGMCHICVWLRMVVVALWCWLTFLFSTFLFRLIIASSIHTTNGLRTYDLFFLTILLYFVFNTFLRLIKRFYQKMPFVLLSQEVYRFKKKHWFIFQKVSWWLYICISFNSYTMASPPKSYEVYSTLQLLLSS